MKLGEYQPKPFTDDDVDIAVSHCGVSHPEPFSSPGLR